MSNITGSDSGQGADTSSELVAEILADIGSGSDVAGVGVLNTDFGAGQDFSIAPYFPGPNLVKGIPYPGDPNPPDPFPQDLAPVGTPVQTDVVQSGNYPPYVYQSSERIAQMVRTRLKDFPTPFSARMICNGTTTRFDLPVFNITQQSVILNNGQSAEQLNETVDYTIAARAGVLFLTAPPPNGVMLQIEGIYFKDFLPAEISAYVYDAFLMHTQGYDPMPVLDGTGGMPSQGTGIYGIPSPPSLGEVEERPLSLLATSLALQDMLINASQQNNIRTPDGVVIDFGQIYSQTQQTLEQVQEQYEKMCLVLDIGLYAIKQTDLRRVSRTTNRLSPLYRAREYDDVLWPQRELPSRPYQGALVTEDGYYDTTMKYATNEIASLNGVRFQAIRPVPPGNSPAQDVNPNTGYGYYWRWAVVGTFSNWYGTW